MQSKRWVFTLNNYAKSDVARFHDAPNRAYVIIGKEVGVIFHVCTQYDYIPELQMLWVHCQR